MKNDPEREAFVREIEARLEEEHGPEVVWGNLSLANSIQITAPWENPCLLIAQMYERCCAFGKNMVSELALRAYIQGYRALDFKLDFVSGRVDYERHMALFDSVFQACTALGLRLTKASSYWQDLGLSWLTELVLTAETYPDHALWPKRIQPGQLIYGWPVLAPSFTGEFPLMLAEKMELSLDTSMIKGFFKETFHCKGSVVRMRSVLEKRESELDAKCLVDALMIENPIVMTAIDLAAPNTHFVKHIWIDGLKPSLIKALVEAGGDYTAIIDRGAWITPRVYDFFRRREGMPWVAMDDLCCGLQAVSIVDPANGNEPQGAVLIGEITDKMPHNIARFQGAYRFE